MADSIQFVPIQNLQTNPFQPREKIHKQDLEELTQSIKIYGILEPLVVAQTPAGLQIIAGERRWRAAKEAGLSEVPVIVRKTSPRGMLEMAIVENLQRIDLSPIERAQAFQQLQRDFGFSNNDVAEKIGKSASYISNSLRLLELPDAIKDGMIGGLITEGHARAIMGIPDERDMIDCYKTILKENASVRRAEELARRYKEANDVFTGRGNQPTSIPDADLKRWQSQLQTMFHTKTQLKLIRSQRQTRISITLQGGPEETQADLDRFLDLTKKHGE